MAFRRLIAAILALWTTAALAGPPPRPRLVVAIAVDQFSAALFEQYRGRFTGGLKRLQEGVVFASGYQSHAATETCPGHSTILTGLHPARTGIVGNLWYDRDLARQVYCVEDPGAAVPGRPDGPRGPGHLKAATLGEWMKAANPASRVFAVSGKDRAAITMAGRGADGTFWWDDERGFNTYVPAGGDAKARLDPVADYDAGLLAKWHRTPPSWQPLDKTCVPGGSSTFAGITINHRLPPESSTGAWNDPANLAWLRASPTLDDVTLEVALRLLDRFKLGRGEAPDLLAVSFSATDYVGHRYGTEGVEMCDQLAHLDRTLGVFLTRLAALKLPVVVVLTADHGSLDAAERIAERGVPASRSPAFSLDALGRAVQAELGLAYNPLAGDLQQIVITGFGQRDPAVDARVKAATLRRLRANPEVEQVFDQAEIAAAAPAPGKPVDEWTVAERFHASNDPLRSGDIQVAWKPYRSSASYPAGHGSPWNHDRRVPILFWWPGASGFEQSLPVETVDIAPTLSALLGLTTPAVDGRCRDLDRDAGDSCATK